MSRRTSPFTFRYRMEAAAWAAIATVLRILPDWALRIVSILLACFAFDLLQFRRRVTLDNLATAFPDLSASERRRIGRKSYRNAVYGMAEFVRLNRPGGKAVDKVQVEVVNQHYLDEVMAGGAFVATLGHLGSWEFLPSFWGSKGLRMAILYKPMHNPFIERKFEELRQGSRIRYLSTRTEPRQMWKEFKEAVSQKRALIFLADQDARKDGVFVPFFGRNASTAAGPATVALRMEIPILPLSCVRMDLWKFRVEFKPPIHPPAGGRTTENIRSVTEQHVAALEAAVREYPEQYMWFHKRWKSMPRKSATTLK